MATQNRLPTGDGFVSQWTALGGGSKYLEVDDDPHDGDSSYLSRTGNAASNQYLTFSPFAIDSSATAKVVVRITARKAAGANITLLGGLVLSGTLFSAAGQTVSSSSYAEYSFEWTTNPLTAAPWTESAIEALDTFNIRRIGGDASSQIRVTQAFIQVDYTPAGGAARRIFNV